MKIDYQGYRVTSDGSPFLVRDLDQRLGLGGVNDVERPSYDLASRLVGSEETGEGEAACPSHLHWFESEVLSQMEDLAGLSRINRERLAKARAMASPQRVVLDMNNTEIRFQF